MTAKTLSIRINCKATQAYDFVSNPRNLPQWASAFCTSVRKTGRQWEIKTPQGPVGFRFVSKNKLGVLDHYVRLNSETEIYVPMRVVAHESKCVIMITIFQSTGMTLKQFADDAVMVQRDLSALKKVLERKY